MISYGLGVIGYVIVLLTLLGVNLMFRSLPQPWMDCGLMCLFYGLYYGVLGRDISEIITDKMAATIGVIMEFVSLNCLTQEKLVIKVTDKNYCYKRI